MAGLSLQGHEAGLVRLADTNTMTDGRLAGHIEELTDIYRQALPVILGVKQRSRRGFWYTFSLSNRCVRAERPTILKRLLPLRTFLIRQNWQARLPHKQQNRYWVRTSALCRARSFRA